MKRYELTTITLKEDQADKVADLIAELGGEIAERKDLGNRRFAYPIQKENSGIYTSFIINMDESKIVELGKKIQKNSAILRHLIIISKAVKKEFISKLSEDLAKAKEETPAQEKTKEEKPSEEVIEETKPAKKTKEPVKDETKEEVKEEAKKEAEEEKQEEIEEVKEEIEEVKEEIKEDKKAIKEAKTEAKKEEAVEQKNEEEERLQKLNEKLDELLKD